MKRILLLFSALMLSCIALWAHDVVIDGIYYNLDKTNKTAEVTYRGEYNEYDNEYSGSVTIPETITYNSEIYNVTSIGEYAFYNCSKLTSVTIPNSVTSIGSSAFSGCSGLTEVTIGNSVTSIGSSAFSGCSGLTEVTIGNSVTSIGKYAFYNTGIYEDESNWDNGVLYIDNCLIDANSDVVKGSYTIKEGTRIIGDFAFRDCSGLTEVAIPNSVTTIGYKAFYNCSGLTSVTIPNSVTSIYYNAFEGCSKLTSVIWNAKNCKDFIKDFSGSTYSLFYDIRSSITSFTFGNEVEHIPAYLCYDMSKLTEMTIPNSVTSIGKDAFYNCSRLTSVIWNAKNCKDFSSSAYSPFYDIRSSRTSFTFGNEVEHIPAFLCYEMSKLTEITIPNSVTSIGKDAFKYCSGLTKVNYLGTVDKWVEIDFNSYYSNPTSYAKNLYINNELLTDVKITTADSIKNYAFYNCQSIKSVEIGESVTSIGKVAFEDCSGLTSVTIPNSVTSIGPNAFSQCSGLTSVTIPNSVTSIGLSAFSFCSGLTSVTIPNSVTSIGSSAFDGCSGLTSVIWNAKNCEDFSSSTFSPFKDIRSSITSFTFGNEVEHIPAYLCYGMSNLTEMTIPNSVTSIGSSAFDGCSGLTEVTIGNSVTSIGKYAFFDCSGLTKVNYLGTVDKWVEIDFEESVSNPTYYAKDLYINNELLADVKITTADSIKNYAFYNCQSIKSVEIGESVTSIGSSAFYGCDKLREVTAYPTTVPNAYKSSFAHYNAYLYIPCDVYEDYDLDDVFGSFKYIKCIAAEEVDAPEKVEIEVDEDNNANVIWPSTDGAKKYELEISKDGEVFCTLLFNENGQLTSIDFGNRSASVGFQFTVTGLDGASKYAYSMVAMDKKGNELQSYKGTFTTNGYVPGPGEEDEPVSITETLADANITVSGGTISADANFSIYNTIGQDVTAFNGSLQPGVYLVSIENNIVKVMVK